MKNLKQNLSLLGFLRAWLLFTAVVVASLAATRSAQAQPAIPCPPSGVTLTTETVNGTGVNPTLVDGAVSQVILPYTEPGIVTQVPNVQLTFTKYDNPAAVCADDNDPLTNFSFPEEVRVTLISPTGTTVDLIPAATYVESATGDGTTTVTVRFTPVGPALSPTIITGSFGLAALGTAFDGEQTFGNWIVEIEDTGAQDPICYDPSTVCLTVERCSADAQSIVIEDAILCPNEDLRLSVISENNIRLADSNGDGFAGYAISAFNSGTESPFAAAPATLTGTAVNGNDQNLFVNNGLPFTGPYNINTIVRPATNFRPNQTYYVRGYTYDNAYVFGSNTPCVDSSAAAQFVVLNPLSATFGHDYQCLGSNGAEPTGKNTAQATIAAGAITGGLPALDPTARYHVSGTGVYQINSVSGSLDPLGMVDLAPGVGLNWVVVDDEPWSLTITDDEGCSFTFNGLFDQPNPQITGLPGEVCTEDPAFVIYDASEFNPFNYQWDEGNFYNGGDPGLDDVQGTGVLGNNIDDSPDGQAIFDPFIAGPGRHNISYIIKGRYDTDPAVDDPTALVDVDNCLATVDSWIDVYPVFNPKFNVYSNGALLTPESPVVLCVVGDTVTLKLDDEALVTSLMAALEPEFFIGADGTVGQSNGSIDEEMAYFVTWSGPGVEDLDDPLGRGRFYPNATAATTGANGLPVGPTGIGDYVVNVTVGYPSCATTYALHIQVVPDVDATINSRTLCGGSTADSPEIDLTTLFNTDGAGVTTTTPGGVFSINPATSPNFSLNGNILSYDPNGPLPYTVTVTYNVGLNGLDNDATPECFDTDTAVLRINNTYTVSFNLPDVLCSDQTWMLADYLTVVDSDGTPVDLSTFGNNAQFTIIRYNGSTVTTGSGSITGTNASNQVYDPLATTSGEVLIRFTATDPNTQYGCVLYAEELVNVRIGGSPVLSGCDKHCEGDGNYVLTVNNNIGLPANNAYSISVVPTTGATISGPFRGLGPDGLACTGDEPAAAPDGADADDLGDNPYGYCVAFDISEVTMYTFTVCSGENGDYSDGEENCRQCETKTITVYPSVVADVDDASDAPTAFCAYKGDEDIWLNEDGSDFNPQIVDLNAYLDGSALNGAIDEDALALSKVGASSLGGVWTGFGVTSMSVPVNAQYPTGIKYSWSGLGFGFNPTPADADPVAPGFQVNLTYTVGSNLDFDCDGGIEPNDNSRCYDTEVLVLTIVPTIDPTLNMDGIHCSTDESVEEIDINSQPVHVVNFATASNTFVPNSPAPGAGQTVTACLNANMLPLSYINDLYITIQYFGITSNVSDGDHDGYTVTGPGGVVLLNVPAPPSGSLTDNHFCAGTAGQFGCVNPEIVIPFADIVAKYGSMEALRDAMKCNNDCFAFNLKSNSGSWGISIRVDYDFWNISGQFSGTLLSATNCQIPDEAFTFDPATGKFYFHTQFTTDGTDDNGNAFECFPAGFYDLAAFSQILVCHETVPCPALGGGLGLTCTATDCDTLLIIPTENADIQDGPICLTQFDHPYIHLPTTLFIDGVTTPGGIWTISDDSPSTADAQAGMGVYGEFFNYAKLPAGNYTVCYSIDRENGAIEGDGTALGDNCGDISVDCATIIVPVRYCVEFDTDQHAVCANCDSEISVIVGMFDPVTGDCVPLIDPIEPPLPPIYGEVCRETSGNILATKPTSEDDPTSVVACGDDYNVFALPITISKGAIIDEIKLQYNYYSTKGTAQGDHDGWGVYFQNDPTGSLGANCNGTHPINGLVLGYADNADPDGDNHFPASFPSTAFENTILGANAPHTADVQAVVDAIPAGKCDTTIMYYYAVSSNSQYWNACFNAEVKYHVANNGSTPRPPVVAIFHETGDTVSSALGFDPIIWNQDGTLEISTCNLAGTEIDIVYNPEYTTTECQIGNGIPMGTCMMTPIVSSTPLVILEDGNAVFNPNVVDVCISEGSVNVADYLYVSSTEGQLSLVPAAGATLTGNVLSFTAAGTYQVAFSTKTGSCNAMDTLTVNVSGPADANFDTNPHISPAVCLGQVVTITPTGSGTTTSLTITNGATVNVMDEDTTAAGVQFTVNGPLGTYTVTHTVVNGTCTDTETKIMTVVDGATIGANDGSVCRLGGAVNLTQFIDGAPLGGSFTPGDQQGSPATGVSAAIADLAINGSVLNPSVLSSGDVLEVVYTYNPNGISCASGADSFYITVVSSADAQFDAPAMTCAGSTLTLTNYFLPNTTVGGSFTATGGTVAADGVTWTAPATGGWVTLTYTVGSGDCQDAYSENIQVVDPETVTTFDYAYLCQSQSDEDGVNLTQFIPAGAQIGSGTFQSGEVPPFISELEYDNQGSNSGHNLEHIEITAAKGKDLSDYAVFFYARDDKPWVNGLHSETADTILPSNARVYGKFRLQGVSGTSEPGAAVAHPTVGNAYNTINESGVGVNKVEVISSGKTIKAASGIDYGAIAFDPNFDIEDGPAGVALVDLRAAATRAGLGLDTLTDAEVAELISDLDYTNNDDVVQFIGYGIKSAGKLYTNGGIFGACDGPAAGMISSDIGVTEEQDTESGSSPRALQFTNACWQVPDVTDAPVNYDTTPDSDKSDEWYSPGYINYGMTVAGNDEFYFDYIAPHGGNLKLDRLCWSLFTVSQVEGAEEGNVDTGDDNNKVEFTCSNPTYTLPFNYELLTGPCGSNMAQFKLTVLMDVEDRWVLPKNNICENQTINLTDAISDKNHWYSGIERQGDFSAEKTMTFAENLWAPYITEIHASYYDYTGEPSDDHHITYNYATQDNPQFPNDYDYHQAYFTEGIEISAPVGTDLSCYQLVFYKEQDLNPNNPPTALGVNVTYIDSTGLPRETDIDDNEYVQLYGSIDEDTDPGANPNGYEVLTVPTFDYYEGTDYTAFGNHYPYYAGVNPNANNYFGNGPAAGGLYLDVNGNNKYDAGDELVKASDFPWEHEQDENPNCDKPGVGSRWFPFYNVPDGVAGVGLLNKCNGELLQFLSWGGQLCVEPYEDFSMAGPFEQLTSTVVDTTQNINGSLGDLRTLQLISCSQLPAGSCPTCEGNPMGKVWVIIYNGGAATVPMCGIETGELEDYQFSNSVGSYNCYLDTNWPVQGQTFDLDLTPLLNYDYAALEADGITYTGCLPNDAIVTGHEVTVQIGTGDNVFQVFTFNVNAQNCAELWDQSVNTSTHHCVVGDEMHGETPFYNDDTAPFYTVVDFCGDCQNSKHNACIPGMLIDEDNDGNVSPLPGDDYLTNYYYNEYTDANECYVGSCTATPKTVYNVGDLRAYIFQGNEIDSKTDSCRSLIKRTDSFTVKMTIKVTYKQCMPVGNFEGSGTKLVEDFCKDQAHWEFDPAGLAALNDEVTITYANANSHDIEGDNVTDDLDCLDDDDEDDLLGDGQRAHTIGISEGGMVSINPAGHATTVCSSDAAFSLNLFLGNGSATNGSWSGTGVQGGMFNPAAAGAGTFTLTYAITGACGTSKTIDITVNAGGGAVTFGSIPATLCASATPIALSATPAGGVWSGDGVSGSNFNPAGLSGDVELTYTAGSGNCTSSATRTVKVYEPLSVSGLQTQCNSEGTAYVVKFNISGGTGSYLVNGALSSASFQSQAMTAGDAYAFTVVDAGAGSDACNDNAEVSGAAPADCQVQCAAEAGALSVNLPEVGGLDYLYCPGAPIEATGTGYNMNGGHAQAYVATNAAGEIISISNDGIFEQLPEGTYNIWGLNFLPGDANIPSVGGNASELSGCFDLSGPIEVRVLPEITISAEYRCDDQFGGYVIDLVITGGTPEYNNFGGYSINYPEITSGTTSVVWDNNLGAAVGTITAGVPGAPQAFQPGTLISVVVSSDGRLCQSEPATVSIPVTECGVGAKNDVETTGAGQPVNFNVMTNDNGNNIRVLAVLSQPANGNITWDENGNFTYVPNAGFSGTDYFTYVITNANGVTSTATVQITVEGSAPGALSATFGENCDQTGTTSQYTVTVTINGGTAPYTITGPISQTTNNSVIVFTMNDGEGYKLTIRDANGEEFVIDNTNRTPCTKVAVELLAFDGEVREEGNFLHWATATEINNDYFILEHSVDGLTFNTIGTIDGNGTTSTAHQYSQLHKEAPAGISYYRLVSVDFDGTKNTYNTITLVRGEAGFNFVSLFPVPVTDKLNVTFTSDIKGTLTANVYDVTGKLVAVKTFDVVKGSNTIAINAANYASGAYFINLNNGVNSITNKFVKK